MYNITLVCTRHRELGECNSDELYKILENLNPEVVFDELPRNSFDFFYSNWFDAYYTNSILRSNLPEMPLEVKCIKKYKRRYRFKIFPVDIDVRQRFSEFQDEISFMTTTFFNHKDYENLDTEKETMIAQEGFHYLNSTRFLDY